MIKDKIPHPWNIGKKGTFQKGHKLSEETKHKISLTRKQRYSKEQLKEWAIIANKHSRTKNKDTKIEQTIAGFLSLLNVGFIPQYKKSVFTFDFNVCGTNKFIECDGDYWHLLPNNMRADKNKEKYCKENNLQLLRLKEFDIYNNPYNCIDRLRRFLAQ